MRGAEFTVVVDYGQVARLILYLVAQWTGSIL